MSSREFESTKSMGKILIEICLISARGLHVGTGIVSSLLKHQWYAVGWLNPEDKYATTIDAPRSDNPVWRTKFATLLELDDDSAVEDSKSSALHVEVYSRTPIFLRNKLHGSATVSLKEFLDKYKQQSSSKSVFEETISYQLRKTNSSKPQGFVDVSIRISAEREVPGGFTGDFGGVMLSNNLDYNSSGQNYMAGSSQHPFAPMNQPNNHHSSMPNPLTNNTYPQMQQPYYPPPPMQPPPPPSNAGYMPSFIPKTENDVNIASSSSPGGTPGGVGRGYARHGPLSSGQSYMAGSSQHQFAPLNQPNNTNPLSVPPNNHNYSMPNPLTNNTYPQMQQPYYPPPSMQPPPPPLPSFIPRPENAVNIPSSAPGGAPGGAGRGYARPGPLNAAGMGAGAIVGAAAAYYGGEYLSGGFDLPTSLPLPNASSIFIDPPF